MFAPATWGNNNSDQPGSPSKLVFDRINMQVSLGLIKMKVKAKEKQNMSARLIILTALISYCMSGFLQAQAYPLLTNWLSQDPYQ